MSIRIFVDKNSPNISQSLMSNATLFSRISSLPDLILGDSREWEVAIIDSSESVQGFAPESSSASYNVKIGIGEAGNANPATYQDTWTFTDTNFRKGKLSTATTGIATLLGTAAQKAAIFEVELITPDGDHQTLCQFPITIRAQVIPGAPTNTGEIDEAYSKTDADLYFPRFLPLVDGLTGGGSTKLDGVVTAGGIVRPKAFRFFITTEFTNGKYNLFQFWPATGLTADGVDIIEPDDFNSTTNNYIWIRRQ